MPHQGLKGLPHSPIASDIRGRKPRWSLINGSIPSGLEKLDFVQTLQEKLLRVGVLAQDYDFETHKKLVPMQLGDAPITYADATALERDFGFTPKITLREGLKKFVVV